MYQKEIMYNSVCSLGLDSFDGSVNTLQCEYTVKCNLIAFLTHIYLVNFTH